MKLLYQLLIVDDEKSVVDSLALTIPWSDYGIEEVHRAYSAAEALEIAGQHAIDIMITDIRMPEMDGLELIDKVNQLSKKIKCIILSGHDDFQFAQKAIQSNTFNYLLKPVIIEELIESVQNAMKVLESEWKEISSYQRIQYTLKSNLPLLKDQLLNDLLNNKPIFPHIFKERLRMLGITFQSGDSFVMMLVRLEEDFSGYDLQSLSLLEYAVTNIAEEVFSDIFELWHGTSEQGYLIFLIKSTRPDSEKLIHSLAVKVQNHVETFLKGSISVFVSSPKLFPQDIATSYQKAVLSINLHVGNNRSYFITSLVDSHNDYTLMNVDEPPHLNYLLQSSRWDEALTKIQRILYIDDTKNDLSYDQLFSIFLYLSSSFSLVLQKEEGNLQEQLGEDFDLFLRKAGFLTSQRLNKWAEKIVQLLKENSTKIMDDSHQQIISRVQSYIQEHLEKGLSLQIISEHVNLHSVYLSKVYKSVTGQTIGDYIFSIRMERAAYFLEYTELKIVDISGKLGFLAPPHFIKIFKKHYNCTPQEYRNSR